jgi:hypothetical protein
MSMPETYAERIQAIKRHPAGKAATSEAVEAALQRAVDNLISDATISMTVPVDVLERIVQIIEASK